MTAIPASAKTQMEVINQRLPVVIIGMVLLSGLMVLRLLSFQQLSADVLNELSPNYNYNVRLASARGIIYDRNGQRLAVNTLDYRIGLSPNLVSNPQKIATQLASILNLDELTVLNAAKSNQPWVLLASRVSAEVGQQVENLKNDGELLAVTIEKLPRRDYPQGPLLAQVLGFVSEDLRGYYGVEGIFQDQLAGRVREERLSSIPFEVRDDQAPENGADVYLTIDRDIQFLAELELSSAVAETGSKSGTIIIMNPRNGDILGLANWPSFDPNDYGASKANDWKNAAISNVFEPGSIMKVLTVAGALDAGVITKEWTYNDQGQLDICGKPVLNWDRQAHGVVDTTGLLVNSLNVGAATISLQMGPTEFYRMLSRFGIGHYTGVNLQGEEAGILYTMNDAEWSQSNLCTNAYGQGLSVTPLQLITSVGAIANDGLMMQPNVVYKIVQGGETLYSQPTVLSRAVSADTAHIVRDMMVTVVRDGLDERAQLPGYTVAGKTGTAEIPTPTGYRSDAWIMTFIGFLPADDPQVIVLVKLDEPKTGNFASQVAAPVFRRLAERLVVLLEIPTDAVRVALEAQNGDVSAVKR